MKLYYDVRNNCKVCGKGVDGVGNATICTYCYNNHLELHYQDCRCMTCQKKRATATVSVAKFADQLGQALCVSAPAKKERKEKRVKTRIYAAIDVYTRVVRPCTDHSGFITVNKESVYVFEVIDRWQSNEIIWIDDTFFQTHSTNDYTRLD